MPEIWSALALSKYTRILGYVAQVTIYVPDEVARRLRREARRAKRSVSAYIVDLVQRRGGQGAWPSEFADLFGSCQLPAIDDAPPEEPPLL